MIAQLHPVDLVAPGFRGVNFQRSRTILPPHWATVARNCFIDENGLLSSRKGYSDVTTTAVTGDIPIETLHEHKFEDGTAEIILAWDDAGGAGIANDIDDPEANIIDGTVAVDSGTWWMQNGWDKCFGFEDGQKPIVRTTGNFATVSEASGTAPTVSGGVGLVAYGRVWALDSDNQIIKFSALNDETHWSTGAGQIDMSSIWTNGTDQVTAITAYGGALVVFGKKHIVFWVDGTGNQLGIDPDRLYVSDIIEGVGCISQWSVQLIGSTGDVIFAGDDGIHSLRRVVETGAGAPTQALSRNIQDAIVADIQDETKNAIRSVVDPRRGIYIISFPSQERSYVFHYTFPYRDEITNAILYPITTWDLAPTAWLWDEGNQRLLLSDGGNPGHVGLYGGLDTDAGTKFTMTYEGPWLDLGEEFANRLKILKRIGSIVFVSSAASITYKWDFDFAGTFTSKTVNFTGASNAEWGSAEFGTDEYSGGLSLRIFKFPATGRGQYIKLGLTLEVPSKFSIQQLELFAKLGTFA